MEKAGRDRSYPGKARKRRPVSVQKEKRICNLVLSISLSFDPIGNNSTPHVFVSLSSVTVPNTNCALRGYVYITATVRTGQAADIGVGLKRGGNKKKKMYLFQKANGLTVGCVMRRKRRGEDSATSLYGDGRECRPSSPQISTPSFSVCLPRGPSLSTRADDSGQLFLF